MFDTMRRYFVSLIIVLFFISPVEGRSIEGSLEAEVETCEECAGETDTGVLYGALDSISLKASMLQLNAKTGTTVVSFDDDTILTGAKDLTSIEPGSNVKIDFLSEDGLPLAVSIDVLVDELDVLEHNQVDAKTLRKILSNDVSPITLIDARSERSYNEEHIPGAISIYHGVFAKHTDKLPANKEQLVIYYCDGTA